MRRALATATIAGAVALIPMTAVSAAADELAAPVGTVIDSEDDTDKDEPLAQDGDDDSGKYGLIGLSGMLGLFGYKKYKDHQAARTTTTGTTGTDGTGTSRRV